MNTTVIMKGEISKAARADGNEAFLDIYGENSDRFDKKLTQQWQSYYSRLSQGCTPRATADRCQCALNTVKKWKTSIPYHREHYVMIGCCFGLSAEEVSKLMSRYGGFSKLRSDSLDDIMYIRLLAIMQRTMSESGSDALNVPSSYGERADLYYAEVSRIQSKGLWAMSRYEMMEGSLLKGGFSDPEFYNMIERSRRSLTGGYHDLSVALVDYRKKIGYRSNRQFYESTGMTPAMQRIFSGMSNEVRESSVKHDLSLRPMPRRRQIIAFCVYLGMPINEINRTLNKANMEELCPREPYEAALLFVLQQLYYKDARFAGREMNGKANLSNQKDLEYLYNSSYTGLFGYVHALLSEEGLAGFLQKMDVDLEKAMCI